MSEQKSSKQGKEFELALANLILGTEWGRCFLCENSMKQISMTGGYEGCDGECRHSKQYAPEEFLIKLKEQFEKEKEWNAEER